MSIETKNSVGVAVMTIMINIMKKYESEFAAFVSSESFNKLSDIDKEKDVEAFKLDFQVRISHNAEKIVAQVASAIQWSGTKDSLSDRLRKVYNSCIVKADKCPLCIKNLIGVHNKENLAWRFMDALVDNLKSSTRTVITEIELEF